MSALARGLAGRLAAAFIDSKLTPIAVLASVLLGLLAVVLLPREEEPQIQVPMIDLFVSMPGATAAEVENRVTRPMEKLLWEVPGVEYLYSTSSPGSALVIVRFEVGSDLVDALVRLNQKLETNYDRIPPGVGRPLIKPRTIDDVPVLALTLHGGGLDAFTLRRLAAQLDDEIKGLDAVAETTLAGGVRRTVRVQLDAAALTAHGLVALEVMERLQQANRQAQLGSRPMAGAEVLLETGTFLRDGRDAGEVVVGLFAGKPVRLREVATIIDGPAEPADYVLHAEPGGTLVPAVTLSVAKRPGANAIEVVDSILERVERLRGVLIPAEVGIAVTRDYGHTAAEKSDELLLHMGIAVFGVAVLILIFLGWRESLVVLLAIPSTLALTLLVFHLYGYTLNRITLFALIFSIGILVDDAIVVVENIVRHVRRPGAERRPIIQVAIEAVDEVGNPTLLATWAVIAAILPMAFVGGLMGPYMRPIPVGATAAMLFSVVVAFTVTPWAAIRVLRRHRREATQREGTKSAAPPARDHDEDHAPDDWSTRLYHRVMDPLLNHAGWRAAFLGGIVVLLLGSAGLVLGGAVEVKMLPFDDKSEFMLIVNTPEGTTLESTAAVAREMAQRLLLEPEVAHVQVYAGTSAPFTFSGLVRHYFLRRGPNVADVQVNLRPKHDRSAQSHDIAKRVRPVVAEIAARHGAVVAVAEVPPGPPVIQTLVAEVYAPTDEHRRALAAEVYRTFAAAEGVVDLDWYIEAPQPKLRFVVDRDKAALQGVSEAAVTATLRVATEGVAADLLHLPAEREDVAIVFELPAAERARAQTLLRLEVRPDLDPSARPVPLSELIRVETAVGEGNRYRKNLRPVVYVTADVAGAVESPAYALFGLHQQITALDGRRFGGREPEIAVHHLTQPEDDRTPAIKWDGEWHITLEVFRDLGLAFGVVLILIYMLMVGWFGRYTTPFVIMAAIPFSLVGILPAHWALGAFFTATSMIGFMAGAGIVVRNSIILVDFIELRRSHGLTLREAVVEAGAVRFRPMLLTALAVVVGASVILADPIFQGLAISLMFGEIASLLISRMAVPVLYFLVARRDDRPAVSDVTAS